MLAHNLLVHFPLFLFVSNVLTCKNICFPVKSLQNCYYIFIYFYFIFHRSSLCFVCAESFSMLRSIQALRYYSAKPKCGNRMSVTFFVILRSRKYKEKSASSMNHAMCNEAFT